jgi:hypothetical protein
MKKILPKIIEEVGFDFNWSVEKVWALDIQINRIDIKKLEWHFKIPFWNTKNGFYDLKPNDVISFPKNYQEEYHRIMKSDLLYLNVSPKFQTDSFKLK